MAALRYRPDIDGLRTLAVVPVVLFHAHTPLFGGGFVGVDVFFVISGFLITSLLLADLERARFSLVSFYERRIRRILPAFFAMVAATAALGALLLPPSELEDLGKSVLASSAFASNILFWKQSGYFAAPAHLKPLLHTWSLAVEEQFYVFFPVLLWAAQRWLGSRARWVVVSIALASLAACIWTTPRDPGAAFYLLPYRCWELLLGSMLALGAVPAFHPERRALRELAALVGLACICGAAAGFSEDTVFPGASALVPCLGAALVIHAGSAGETRVGRLLASAPFVYVGKISYSVYLWHWPLLVLAAAWSIDPLTPLQTTAVLALTFLLSALSYTFVEQPFRRHDPTLPRARWKPFVAAFGATAAMLAFGLSCRQTHGFPSRVSDQVATFDRARNDSNPDRRKCHANDDDPIAYEDKCVYGARGEMPTMAIWGDSFAAELAVALGELAADRGESLLYVSYSGCAPAQSVFSHRPACESHNAMMLERLNAERRIKRVVLVANYGSLYRRFGPSFLEGLESVVVSLRDAGKDVVLTYPIPTPDGHVPSQLARAAHMGHDLGSLSSSRAKYDRDNAEIIAFLDRLTRAPGTRAVHPEHTFCTSDRCDILREGHVLYFDDGHLSVAGARLLRPSFAAALTHSMSAALTP